MNKVRELVMDIMGRYAKAAESACRAVKEFTEELPKEIVESAKYYGMWLLVGLLVALAWIILAVTMPIWYMPYKYFIRKGEKYDNRN